MRRSRPVPVRCQARFLLQPDRLSPQSQSFSRSYGSDLPTSLTYIVLSTRGCSPWRPAADMGTVRRENQDVLLGFSRADKGAPDTARAAVLYGNLTSSLSPGKPIPGSQSLTKKRQLFPGPLPTSPSRFASPHETPKGRSPHPGSGMLTRFPFGRRRANFVYEFTLAFERTSPIP